MKTRRLPLDYTRPANPLPRPRAMELLRAMVAALEAKYGKGGGR